MERLGRSILDYIRITDKFFWMVMVTISAYSLLLMKTVPTLGGRSLPYFAVHLLAMAMGYFAAWFVTLIDYREMSNIWYIIAGFCIFLLIYTHLFGIAVENSGGVSAKAWIKLPGGLTFQPSELVKIGFMLTFSKHISVLKSRGLLDQFFHVALLGVHALIPVAWMFILQGDAGSAVIFFCMFLAMSFGAGVQLRYVVGLLAAVGILLPIVWNYTDIIQPYQRTRLMIFLNPDSDPTGAGLQQLQGRLSIGSGQMWGRGLFTAPRVQRGNVPVQQSDYIFSVAGEQLGFLGCTLILLLLLLLLLRVLHNANHATDTVGKSICYGYFGMIAAQAAFNLGMCLNLFPVMGVTLPFFSYGGSSSACLYLGFGLVQSVVMHRVSPDKVVLLR